MMGFFSFRFKNTRCYEKFNLPYNTVHKRKENCSMKITFELDDKEFEELKDLIFGTKMEDINEKRMKSQPFYKMDDVIFGSQEDAYAALAAIMEYAQLYGFVSVAEYKDIAGVKACYTDNRWGWVESDLNEAHVYRVRNGYGIWLPYPKIIMD